MKKEQQILNKLAKYNEVQKVELSAEEPIKVEFALIDDLDKLSNNVKQIASDHRNDVVQFQQAVQKLASSYKGKVQQSVDLLTAIRSAEKMASDLGVDINLSKYKTILDDYYKAVQVLDDLIAKAKNL